MLRDAIDSELQQGRTTDQIYTKLANIEASTISETIKSPKIIDNRKYKQKSEQRCEKLSEVDSLIKLVKEDSLVRSVVFMEDHYMAINFLPQMLKDMNRFCVTENGVFSVDTTFEICNGLYLTDTTYPNFALLDDNGKHPEFPGPSFWHFRKDSDTYRRFAGELVIAMPELQGIRRVGHDLDKALAKGNVMHKNGLLA